MAPIPAAGTNLGTSWGSTLAAVFISLVFYGVSILQTFIYYERYPKDTFILKSLVAFVFVLDTLHTFLISIGVWQYFVLHFGDETFILYTHPPLLISIVVTSAVSSAVQSFFIYRIWSLTRNWCKWVFPVVLLPFVVAQLVLGAFYTVTAMVFDTSVEAVSGSLLTRIANSLNGVATAVDITITIALCTLLAMGRTGIDDTDRMLLRLIFISVNTGLWSALFAFLSVILLVIYPKDLIFTALYYPLCTVYCNTLLASLNARSYARGGSNTHTASHRHRSLVWRRTADTDSDQADQQFRGTLRGCVDTLSVPPTPDLQSKPTPSPPTTDFEHC
ncbi:hypothetical protein BS17DRAFT_55366 [Gyrodon lividus]|nr:hypothetical protein BS17DRAFT_55366 [Gyrodon lividus]